MSQPPPPPPSSSPNLLSSTIQSLVNHFKPHRAEALHRIRINALGLLLVFLITNLLPLPIPSVQRAVWIVAMQQHGASSSASPLLVRLEAERWETDAVWRWICVLEAATAGLLSFNILQSIHAIKYPRSAPPPHPSSSPAKQKAKPLFNSKNGQNSPHRPFKILSPNTSPQPQRPFSTPSASFRGLGSTSASASVYPYPPSPLSSPSKTVHYPPVPNSVAVSSTTQASSLGMLGTPSPSPVVAAYRGRHTGVGHALDESVLSQIVPRDEDCGGKD